jgi:tetratricopeptide (TPR) repeat protein
MKPTRLGTGFLFTIFFLSVSGGMYGCVDSQRGKIVKNDRIFAEASSAARDAFAQDRTAEAVSLYILALNRARAMDQSEAIGNAAYNLAACLLRLKQYDRARALLAEARHELVRRDLPLADVLLLQARAACLAGDVQGASLFVHQVQTGSQSKPSSEHMAQAVMLEGRMACDRQDWSRAADLLNQARDYPLLGADTLLQAQFASLAGRIALGEGDFKAAVKALERQAGLLRHAGRYRALSPVLAQAGEAYSVLNEHDLAADRLYRAARIAAAWGDTAAAEKFATAALHAGSKAGDSAIPRLAKALLAEITH